MTAEGQAQLFGGVMRFRGIAQDWAKECANYRFEFMPIATGAVHNNRT